MPIMPLSFLDSAHDMNSVPVPGPRAAAAFALAMVAIVLSSNILVQYPLNDWLTWGAVTYPFSFLVVDLATRYYGARAARVKLSFCFHNKILVGGAYKCQNDAKFAARDRNSAIA